MINDIAYLLHVTTHETVNLSGYGLPDESVAFRELLRTRDYSKKALVVAIDRVKNEKIFGAEADTPIWKKKGESRFELDSAVLSKMRVAHDMEALELALFNGGKSTKGVVYYVRRFLALFSPSKISRYSPSEILFAYIRMYATFLFSDIGDGPFAYRMLTDLPTDSSEPGWFVVWGFNEEPREQRNR